jgi:hypothetical protein
LEVLECQPFGGPLTVSFEGGEQREHALGGQLAGAMRVEVECSSPKPAVPGAEDLPDEHA